MRSNLRYLFLFCLGVQLLGCGPVITEPCEAFDPLEKTIQVTLNNRSNAVVSATVMEMGNPALGTKRSVNVAVNQTQKTDIAVLIESAIMNLK